MEKGVLKRTIGIIKIKFAEWVDGFFSVLYFFNESCIICGRDTDNNHILCNRCREKKFLGVKKKIRMDEYSFNAICCYYYNKELGDAIRSMKYYRDFKVIRGFAEDFKSIIINENMYFDLITFVPSEKGKLRSRGFNQSELLSNELFKSLRDKRWEKIQNQGVLCKRRCKDQIGLTRMERWRNVEDVFYVNDKYKKMLKNKKIILIDDVLTSGATAYYCSKRMIEAGAEEVVIMTIASANI